jgi:hypothetical protein
MMTRTKHDRLVSFHVCFKQIFKWKNKSPGPLISKGMQQQTCRSKLQAFLDFWYLATRIPPRKLSNLSRKRRKSRGFLLEERRICPRRLREDGVLPYSCIIPHHAPLAGAQPSFWIRNKKFPHEVLHAREKKRAENSFCQILSWCAWCV